MSYDDLTTLANQFTRAVFDPTAPLPTLWPAGAWGVFLVFVTQIGAGIPLGVLMGWYRPIDYILDPFVSFMYATPRVALLPLMIIWLGMLLMWGLRPQYVALLAGAGLALVVIFLLTAPDYQKQRLITFLKPNDDPLGAGYNVTQARISIGSGGWTGQGYLSGTQSQLKFLRARQTDFIFSVLAEELGFFGAIAFMLLMTLVLWRMLRAAQLARDAYGRLIAAGLAVMLFFQTAVNLGMNVGILPVTGIPLPFISFGGSSVISLLVGQGLIQSIVMRHRKLEFE